jgi:hypothetical protein
VAAMARRRWRGPLALSALLALAACGGGGSSGGPPPPAADAEIRVTGPSPFAPGCDGVAATGTLYANAEVEPMIATESRDANHLVGVWQQDRWSDGAARGLLTGVSFDGGQTWAPYGAAFSRCAGGNAGNGGDYPRATDPWVSIGPDGTVHQSALAVVGDVLQPGSASAILASRSTDGGRTWSNPVALRTDGEDAFNDKDSLTADPTDPRLVYATWDRLKNTGGGPTYFARSTDGGSAWEPARPIYDPGTTSQTINNQIVVLPDGTLVDFCTRILQTLPGSLEAMLVVIRSFDQGLTWTAPATVADVQTVGTHDPQAGTPIRDASGLGAIAAGPHGELAVVWQDARFSGGARDGIAFSTSTDAGLTWSAPVQVNRDPGVPAFVPSVAYRSDGTVGVTYYDLRNNTLSAATLPTDYWLVRSPDGADWTESHVAGPFDLAIASNAEGLFLGDYEALTVSGNTFVPFYVRTNDGDLANRTDVFARRVAAAATTKAAVRAPTAPPLVLTPELARRVSAAVLRTLQRRVPGWTPAGVVRPPARPR